MAVSRAFMIAALLTWMAGTLVLARTPADVRVDRPAAGPPGVHVDSQTAPEALTPQMSRMAAHGESRPRTPTAILPFKVCRGNPRLKWIALTFDDGPHHLFTPQLLDILRQYRVHATFFVVGRKAAMAPDLIYRELAEGHELGDHTYSHPNLNSLTPPQVADEILRCDQVLYGLTGIHTRLFRPPGGDYDHSVVETARRLGFVTVLWTMDPGDYRKPSGEVIEDRLMQRLEGGAIFLLHDGIPQTMEILPNLIETAQMEGYRFVTVSQLLDGMRTLDNSAGFVRARAVALRKPAPPATGPVPAARDARPSTSRRSQTE